MCRRILKPGAKEEATQECMQARSTALEAGGEAVEEEGCRGVE